MSKRYGRNQKRKAQAEIQRLNHLLTEAEARASRFRLRAENEARRATDARAEAFDEFARRSAYYDHIVDHMTGHVARAFGEELARVAQGILTRGGSLPPVRLSLRPGLFTPNAAKDVITLRIDPIAYCYAINRTGYAQFEANQT